MGLASSGTPFSIWLSEHVGFFVAYLPLLLQSGNMGGPFPWFHEGATLGGHWVFDSTSSGETCGYQRVFFAFQLSVQKVRPPIHTTGCGGL